MIRDLSASSKLLKPRPQYRNVDETALELNVSTKTIRRLIDRGELLANRIGRSIRISEEDLHRYIRGSRR